MSSDILEKKEKALRFLNDVIPCLGDAYKTDITVENDSLSAEITGGDLSLFTERDGRILEALRIITASVINDKDSEYVKFNIDAGDFRQKKNDKIKEIALSIAERVKAEGEGIALPDMNSYDRRIAHMALQDDPLIRTESEGEEPHRHLVVYPTE